MEHSTGDCQHAPSGCNYPEGECVRVCKLKLPNDVARCAGVGDDIEGWREGCEDCQRRTAGSVGEQLSWIEPPAIIVFCCEFRIGD